MRMVEAHGQRAQTGKVLRKQHVEATGAVAPERRRVPRIGPQAQSVHRAIAVLAAGKKQQEDAGDHCACRAGRRSGTSPQPAHPGDAERNERAAGVDDADDRRRREREEPPPVGEQSDEDQRGNLGAQIFVDEQPGDVGHDKKRVISGVLNQRNAEIQHHPIA